MTINFLEILNFKSILKIRIENATPFMVFFGSNASGKSNIFESIEIASLIYNLNEKAFDHIRNLKDLKNFNNIEGDFILKISPFGPYTNDKLIISIVNKGLKESCDIKNSQLYQNFDLLSNFSRIFIGQQDIKYPIRNDIRLSSNCENLEAVLKRVLNNSEKREELIETLSFLIPGFENVEIEEDKMTGKDRLLIFENSTSRPFTKGLISDGTYNILCLLTIVLQEDKPQFLCIEEPENGLNPKVVREFVRYFRDKCEEKGHYIWLNTHSQTLVSELNQDEAILVEKKDGATSIIDVRDINLHGLKIDEAWLSNVLGGGNPW